MIQNYLSNNANRYTSKWVVLLIDVLTVSISFFLAYCIRFNLSLDFDVDKLYTQLPFVALVSIVAFLIVGAYKGVVLFVPVVS